MLIAHTLLILVGAHFVKSSVFKNDFAQQPFLVKSYNYNHPPLLESSKGLNVDNVEVRKVRQLSLVGSSIKSKPDSDTTATAVSQGSDVSPSNKIKRRRQRKRPNRVQETKEEVKITEIEHASIKEVEVSSTERPSSTSPGPRTIVPKVFTKRPAQYNPRFKKVTERVPDVKIVESSNHVYGHNGNFEYSFEGADGTKISSEGKLKSFDDNKTGEAVVGSVFYKDNEGNDYSLSYTADENGYRPSGAHLPTPPPIPVAIARALKLLATKTTPEPVTKSYEKIN